MPAKTKYKEHLSKIDYVPIYFQDWYLDGCSPPGKWSYVTHQADNGDFGVWPYFIKKKSIFNYITMPHLCKWLGPLTTTTPGTPEHDHLISAMLKKFPEHHHFTQNLFYDSTDVSFQGFDVAEKYSYQLDLTRDIETIFSKLNSDYRNNKIPKAKDLILDLDAPVDDIIEMQMASYTYAKFDIPFDEKYVRKHVKNILKKKKGTILSMRDGGGQLYASMFLMWDDKRSYYHLAGMNPELRKTGASIRLIWECIKYSKETVGAQIFDFEGSMIPNLERVRRNFGAEKIYYKNIAKTPSKLFDLMKMVKR